MKDLYCKQGTFNIATGKGNCPENCKYGAWNEPDGICGAECEECGGDLYLTSEDTVYCADCNGLESNN